LRKGYLDSVDHRGRGLRLPLLLALLNSLCNPLRRLPSLLSTAAVIERDLLLCLDRFLPLGLDLLVSLPQCRPFFPPYFFCGFFGCFLFFSFPSLSSFCWVGGWGVFFFFFGGFVGSLLCRGFPLTAFSRTPASFLSLFRKCVRERGDDPFYPDDPMRSHPEEDNFPGITAGVHDFLRPAPRLFFSFSDVHPSARSRPSSEE